ncbi:MAG: manganese efflux pump [Firmicutes bacterium]|nr:manganese efflux pump [Bacillota bacterium]
MWIVIAACLLVSIDALFIGISFGAEKKCKFWHIVFINIGLFVLCLLGYFLGVLIGDVIDIELDILIGVLFITLGLWVIGYYLLFTRRAKGRGSESKNIALTGIFMSIEAMFITIGLTLALDITTIIIPVVVAGAHFVYCTVTFLLAKYLRRTPQLVGVIISGVALIVYGIMAILI